ncbi:unnamed protein product [Peniophora sp. CBMAI 1063]|nr:unnamed protein product [Peniophora sp. CBMAI 1063]
MLSRLDSSVRIFGARQRLARVNNPSVHIFLCRRREAMGALIRTAGRSRAMVVLTGDVLHIVARRAYTFARKYIWPDI